MPSSTGLIGRTLSFSCIRQQQTRKFRSWKDLFFETNGEFFGVWDRIKPTIKEGRERFSNKLFAAHIEKAASRFESWAEKRSPGLVASIRQMTQQMRAQVKRAA